MFSVMRPDFKSAREGKGWSQVRAASHLGVSQSYVALLESGKRSLPPRLARKAMRVLGLSPTALPPSSTLERSVKKNPNQVLAEELAALGYPGFGYLRRKRQKKNPAQVLLTAVAQDDLEARLVEALPWVLFRYSNVDPNELVKQAKLRDVQNRLGFVTTLARQTAERMNPQVAKSLRELEAALEPSVLAKEVTLGRADLAQRERQWLTENRPEEAKRWHVLTDWRVDLLPYAKPQYEP